MSLLDVGCGPGTITADFARRLDPGPVIGIDREETPLREARALAPDAANLTFRSGDVYTLDLGDASVDVVHVHQVLQHLVDPVAALVELRRVCRPEGVVAARDADMATMTWFPAEPVLDQWLAVYHAVARANGAEPDAGRHLVSWAHAAGFVDVIASASAWCFARPDQREWWAGLWAERTTRSAFADQAIAYGVASARELDDIATGFMRWAADEDAWFAVLHGEVLCRNGLAER